MFLHEYAYHECGTTKKLNCHVFIHEKVRALIYEIGAHSQRLVSSMLRLQIKPRGTMFHEECCISK